MRMPGWVHVRLVAAVVLVAACADPARPTPQGNRAASGSPLRDASAASYDMATLQHWFTDASPAVLEISSAVYADLNEQTNRLEFGVLDEATRSAAGARLASLGIPSDAWLIEIVGPIASEQGARLLTDQTRPTVGGIQIQNTVSATATGTCTLSFNVQLDGKHYFVTCSHCTQVRGGVESTPFFQSLRNKQAGSSIGVENRDPAYVAGGGCPGGRLCRKSDAALVLYNASTRSTPSRIARPDRVNTGSVQIDAAQPTFAIAFVAGTTEFRMGALANKVGRSTGWSQGPVSRTCADINLDNTNITLLCQTQVQYNTAQSDSGAPVFEISADGSVVLWGIHASGQTTNGVKFGWFSPFPAIASELGFTTIQQ